MCVIGHLKFKDEGLQTADALGSNIDMCYSTVLDFLAVPWWFFQSPDDK